MPGQSRARVAPAGTFAAAACRYWFEVFPRVGREVRRWRARAGQIPDPTLRRLALVTQRTERGNLDGAAAFAVMVPRAHRQTVVRALVAFQAAYDFLDTLAEQPCADPLANGRQLHLALLTALDPGGEHLDYYAHSPAGRDGGYVRSLIDACRAALGALPSYPSVFEPAHGAARRMVAFQAFNHLGRRSGTGSLARWAATMTPPDSGLRWWETAAAAASSLGVFALIAAAAQPCLSVAETAATVDAYFPWIGALHVLLDSLVDHVEDLDAGRHNLVEHYASSEEAAQRLRAIAARAMAATEALSAGTAHGLIVAAMSSFYLSAPRAHAPWARRAASGVRETLGASATPALLVLGARRKLLDALSGRIAYSELESQVVDFPLVAWTARVHDECRVRLGQRRPERATVQDPLSSRQ